MNAIAHKVFHSTKMTQHSKINLEVLNQQNLFFPLISVNEPLRSFLIFVANKDSVYLIGSAVGLVF